MQLATIICAARKARDIADEAFTRDTAKGDAIGMRKYEQSERLFDAAVARANALTATLKSQYETVAWPLRGAQ